MDSALIVSLKDFQNKKKLLQEFENGGGSRV